MVTEGAVVVVTPLLSVSMWMERAPSLSCPRKGQRGAHVITKDGTARIARLGHGGAEGEVVADGATIIAIAHDAAVVIAAGEAIGNGERGAAGTVADGAAVAVAYNAAVILTVVRHGVDGHVVGYGTASNSAVRNVAHNATAGRIGGDAGVVERNVLYLSTFFDEAEETFALMRTASLAIIYSDAHNGLTTSVEMAVERMTVVADAREVALGACGIVPSGGGTQRRVDGIVEVDVVHHLEVLAAVSCAAVHVVGEFDEVFYGLDLVGLCRCALIARIEGELFGGRSPRRSSSQQEKCQHQESLRFTFCHDCMVLG